MSQVQQKSQAQLDSENPQKSISSSKDHALEKLNSLEEIEPPQIMARTSRQEDHKISIQKNVKAAAGLSAVVSSLKEIKKHTGLLTGAKLLSQMNQRGGFDCPGCAWPDPQDRSHFEFCENGVKAVSAEATRKRVDPQFFEQWSLRALSEKSDYWLEDQGRLTHPMWKEVGASHYQPIQWDHAFSKIANHIIHHAKPQGSIFYTSGRSSNEVAFLYQLMVRCLGVNHLPDCSNMCHESSGQGLGQTIGIGKGTVQLSDFEQCDCILVIGQNPGTNHPRMLSSLEAAAARGCKIIAINPLRERGLERFAHPQKPLALLGKSQKIATQYVQVKINGDVALLKGIMKAVFDLDEQSTDSLIDYEFINTHTQGFDAFKRSLDQVEWTEIIQASGCSEAEIRQVAYTYAHAKASIICWAMGLTQHKNGVGNIQEVVNLLLLKGNIGRQGAGACPVRGHSNVQGDRTMGIVERPATALLDRLGEYFKFSPPREHGYDVVHSIHAMYEEKAKFFMGLGGNFVSATPDTDYTAKALQKCSMTVQISTKLNRSHLITGQEAFILPCLGRTELDQQQSGTQFVTVENSMSVVHRSQGKRKPASPNLLSEVMIIARLAHALFNSPQTNQYQHIKWLEMAQDYSKIRTHIEHVIPGFDHYEQRSEQGFVLPNSARERQWKVKGQKAHFTVHMIPQWTLADHEFLMMTIRSHDQYNTTIYGWDDRYRGIFGSRRVIMMNAEDMKHFNMVEGQSVKITSHFQKETRSIEGFTVVMQSIPRQCVATYFPEANPLIPARSIADMSHTPTSKSVIVTIEAMP